MFSRNTLPSNDPRKVDATQAKGTRGKSEVRFRAKADARLMATITDEQKRALDAIYHGYCLAIAGLPRAQMRYDDAPRSPPQDLTPRLLQVMRDYESWRVALMGTRECAAVMAYTTTGAGIRTIERECRIRSGCGYAYIRKGLREYVNMVGWNAVGNDNAKMRMIGEKPTQMPSPLQIDARG